MGDRAPSPPEMQVGVVVSTFNSAVTSGLLDGALEALRAHGLDAPTVVEVAGAFELPVVARALIDSGHDCVVALGAVICGETDHYEHVATQSIRGLMDISVETGVPVTLGVLTVREAAHALERSRPGPGNKGAEAADAAVTAVRAVRAMLEG
jgi:6,7-dimethyl-8-ribityllumazine synthase